MKQFRRIWRPDDREIAVMEKLAELAGDHGSCIIDRAQLANGLRISADTLSRSLKRLEAFGYLKRETRYPKNKPEPFSPPPRGHRATRYTIVKMPAKTDQHDVGASARVQ